MGQFRGFLGFAAVAIALAPWVGSIRPAQASLNVCNHSSRVTYVAVGYSLGEGRWQSEGWLLLSQGQCGTVVPGNLEPGSYYYLYAADKDEDRVWQGDTGEQWFCIKPEADFRLVFEGENCPDPETARRIFWEIRVRGTSHTENLVD